MQDLRELAAQRDVVLADHRIALLYECRGVTPATAVSCTHLTFDQLASLDAEPALLDLARLKIDSSRSLTGRPVWQMAAPTLSPDLHSIAATILGGSAAEEREKTSCLGLTEQGLNLLAGLYRSLPTAAGEASDVSAPGLGLHLTKTVAEYLGLGSALPVAVEIDKVSLFPFRTGIGLVVVELRLLANAGADPSLPLLIEATHLLGDERASRRPVFSWRGAGEKRFRLSDLLRSLLSHAGLSLESDRRIFTYVSAVVDGAMEVDAKREIAFRLSRRYNYVYDPDVQGKEVAFLTPFRNVTHAMSLEGVATLVDRPPRASAQGLPEFLSNWLSVAHRPVYLPITLIAYHEYLALLELAQEASVDIDFTRPTTAEGRALTRLCQRFLSFRLRYRPAQVSRITMHNSFSDQVRLALGSDRLAQKAAQDAAEAEQVIAGLSREAIERSERQRERRWAWHGAFLGGLVALMAVLGLFDELGEVAGKLLGGEESVTKVTMVAAPPSTETVQPDGVLHGLQSMTAAEGIRAAGVPVALIIGLVGAFISWARLRHSEHSAEETGKELNQQRIERRLKDRKEHSEKSVRRSAR